MMTVIVIHATGELACWNAGDLPRVGDTISFTGERHDCRTVTRVDWQAYVTKEGTTAALERVVVFVE